MARSSDPNSAGSQFFVMVADYPSLDGQYSAFGQVVAGLETADAIVSQPRDARDMPKDRVEMTVEVVE
jgi:peptidyl-prolyl cis-trans isomerase B (cyclophilin B)